MPRVSFISQRLEISISSRNGKWRGSGRYFRRDNQPLLIECRRSWDFLIFFLIIIFLKKINEINIIYEWHLFHLFSLDNLLLVPKMRQIANEFSISRPQGSSFLYSGKPQFKSLQREVFIYKLVYSRVVKMGRLVRRAKCQNRAGVGSAHVSHRLHI